MRVSYREKLIESGDASECHVCKRENVELQVHHRDGDRDNNDSSNLVALCVLCHRKVHNGGYWRQNDEMKQLERELHGTLPDPRGDTRKIRKNFSLSADVVKQLEKEDNMSGLIEELLRNYFNLNE